MSDAPCGADGALLLPAEHGSLQVKMLVERVHRAVAPNEIVFVDRVEKFRPLGQLPRNGIQDKARVERGDEGDVDGEAGRVLDLGDFHAVDLLALLLAYQ